MDQVPKGKETSKIEKVVKGQLESKKVEEKLAKKAPIPEPITRKDRRKAKRVEEKKAKQESAINEVWKGEDPKLLAQVKDILLK